MTTCVKNDSIVVIGCDCTTDWIGATTSCRLRLTASYFDGQLLACNLATPSALPPWDGTLPFWDGAQYLSVANAPTTLSISGHKFFGANLNFVAGHWNLGIAGDTGGISNGMWIGQLFNACPIGIYNFVAGCQAQVATLTLEPYVP